MKYSPHTSMNWPSTGWKFGIGRLDVDQCPSSSWVCSGEAACCADEPDVRRAPRPAARRRRCTCGCGGAARRRVAQLREGRARPGARSGSWTCCSDHGGGVCMTPGQRGRVGQRGARGSRRTRPGSSPPLPPSSRQPDRPRRRARRPRSGRRPVARAGSLLALDLLALDAAPVPCARPSSAAIVFAPRSSPVRPPSVAIVHRVPKPVAETACAAQGGLPMLAVPSPAAPVRPRRPRRGGWCSGADLGGPDRQGPGRAEPGRARRLLQDHRARFHHAHGDPGRAHDLADDGVHPVPEPARSSARSRTTLGRRWRSLRCSRSPRSPPA